MFLRSLTTEAMDAGGMRAYNLSHFDNVLRAKKPANSSSASL